jgi:prevent-host-death family protein
VKTVTAAEANRHFSKLLKEVANGETVVVTSHGQAVARILPVDDDAAERARQADAVRRHLARLATQPVQPIAKWTREELYDDEPPHRDD